MTSLHITQKCQFTDGASGNHLSYPVFDPNSKQQIFSLSHKYFCDKMDLKIIYRHQCLFTLKSQVSRALRTHPHIESLSLLTLLG